MRHFYVTPTGLLACGLPQARRSWTIHIGEATCERCLLAARAARKDAARCLRLAFRQLTAEQPLLVHYSVKIDIENTLVNHLIAHMGQKVDTDDVNPNDAKSARRDRGLQARDGTTK